MGSSMRILLVDCCMLNYEDGILIRRISLFLNEFFRADCCCSLSTGSKDLINLLTLPFSDLADLRLSNFSIRSFFLHR